MILGTSIARSAVHLPEGSFTAVQSTSRVEYAPTSRTSVILLLQTNNEERRVDVNLRFGLSIACNLGYSPVMAPPSWILLSSRVPREPTRLRLAIWRRLKRVGAILIHDAVWMLPAGPDTREAFEWLAEEIDQQGGTAWVWEAASLSPAQDREAVELFRREADARYAEIAASAQAIRDAALGGRRRGGRARPPSAAMLAQAVRQLRGLERALRLERRRDYYRAGGRAPAAALVSAAIAELEPKRSIPHAEGATRALGD